MGEAGYRVLPATPSRGLGHGPFLKLSKNPPLPSSTALRAEANLLEPTWFRRRSNLNISYYLDSINNKPEHKYTLFYTGILIDTICHQYVKNLKNINIGWQ